MAMNEKVCLGSKVELLLNKPEDFNGGLVTLEEGNSITLTPKDQPEKIKLVDINANVQERTAEYVAQRARCAYIAALCQPEALYDSSVAAQAKEPADDDIRKLNKRLQWQLDNKTRGLRYIPINPKKMNLYIFVDGSFANNKDYSSQIGILVALAEESPGTTKEEIILKGNIIHSMSVKSKRVTRSVLASELYSMVLGVDIGIAISTTLRMISKHLQIPDIPTVICTDSLSLYECMVKLGTTNEKRLMIDIMAIRQSYERKELDEIRWISGQSNPADAMTKGIPNRALESLIDKNEVRIRVEGWVEREEEDKETEKEMYEQ